MRLQALFLFFSGAALFVDGQGVDLSVNHPPCHVCGPGFRVRNKEVDITFPGQSKTTKCGDLEDKGLRGAISESFCSIIPPLVASACSCVSGVAAPNPNPAVASSVIFAPLATLPHIGAPPKEAATPAPTPNPAIASHVTFAPLATLPRIGNPPQKAATSAPVTSSPITESPVTSSPITPAPISSAPVTEAPISVAEKATPTNIGGLTNPICVVCGENKHVTQEEALVYFPGDDGGSVSCGILEIAGARGDLDASICPLLPQLIGEPCGCVERTVLLPATVARSSLSRKTLAPENPGKTAFPSTSPVMLVNETDAPVAPPVVLPTTGSPVTPMITEAPIVADESLRPPCHVCGQGNVVSKLENIIQIPGEDPLTCIELEYRGLQSQIYEVYCPSMVLLATRICGCVTANPVPEIASAPPVVAPAVVAPNIPPSPFPSSPPTTLAPIKVMRGAGGGSGGVGGGSIIILEAAVMSMRKFFMTPCAVVFQMSGFILHLAPVGRGGRNERAGGAGGASGMWLRSVLTPSQREANNKKEKKRGYRGRI